MNPPTSLARLRIPSIIQNRMAVTKMSGTRLPVVHHTAAMKRLRTPLLGLGTCRHNPITVRLPLGVSLRRGTMGVDSPQLLLYLDTLLPTPLPLVLHQAVSTERTMVLHTNTEVHNRTSTEVHHPRTSMGVHHNHRMGVPRNRHTGVLRNHHMGVRHNHLMGVRHNHHMGVCRSHRMGVCRNHHMEVPHNHRTSTGVHRNHHTSTGVRNSHLTNTGVRNSLLSSPEHPEDMMTAVVGGEGKT